MGKRLVDKSKKANIKCEYCEHFDRDVGVFWSPKCKLTGEPKAYWNRCKNFEWSKSKEYKEQDLED